MARDRQTEAQLIAMAGNADRANRPRVIVIVCLMLAAAALVLVLVQALQFSSNRSLLAQRKTETESVRSYVERTETLREQGVDLANLFPYNPSIADRIQSIANEVTRDDPRSQVLVEVPSYRDTFPVDGDPSMQTTTVRATFVGTPLSTEHLMRWLERVQRAEGLEGTFVQEIRIKPGVGGRWSGSVNFRRYEYVETAR